MSGSNSSATSNYLRSLTPDHSGQDLRRAFQQMVVNITGIPGELVRPRWQPTPANQPSVDTNWVGIGIVQRDADDYPWIEHDPNWAYPPASGIPGTGADRMQRHETLTIASSFYGPDSEEFASALRDGLYLQQNTEPLQPLGLKLLDVADVQAFPELVNMQWIPRADLTIRMRRQIDRVYPILNIESAAVALNAQDVQAFFIIEQ